MIAKRTWFYLGGVVLPLLLAVLPYAAASAFCLNTDGIVIDQAGRHIKKISLLSGLFPFTAHTPKIFLLWEWKKALSAFPATKPTRRKHN
jgi:hypothetical protein